MDAKTFQGPWASMCDRHWRTWTAFPPATQDADPELGTGKGQRYSLEPAPSLAEVSDVRRAKAEHAASIGDFDSFMEAVGDGDPMDFL